MNVNVAQEQEHRMQRASVLNVPGRRTQQFTAESSTEVSALKRGRVGAREYLHEKGRTVEPRRPEGPQGPPPSQHTHTTLLRLQQPGFALMA